jgi:hypothetical protein
VQHAAPYNLWDGDGPSVTFLPQIISTLLQLRVLLAHHYEQEKMSKRMAAYPA